MFNSVELTRNQFKAAQNSISGKLHFGVNLFVPLAMTALMGLPHSASAKPVSTVILISVDGLGDNLLESIHRPDLLEQTAGTSVDKGAHKASKALTVSPPLTMPAHISMLAGVEPSRHQRLDDGDDSGDAKLKVPTIFDLIARYGKAGAAVVGKEKLYNILNNGSLKWLLIPEVLIFGHLAAYIPRSVDDAALDELSLHHPNLLLIHYPVVDTMGHIFKWGSEPQKFAANQVVDSIERIFKRESVLNDSNYVVIVTSDHGGHLGGHGQVTPDGQLEDPEDLVIPWIIYGADLTASTVHIYDTAPTIAALLDMQVPADYGWQGQNVSR